VGARGPYFSRPLVGHEQHDADAERTGRDSRLHARCSHRPSHAVDGGRHVQQAVQRERQSLCRILQQRFGREAIGREGMNVEQREITTMTGFREATPRARAASTEYCTGDPAPDREGLQRLMTWRTTMTGFRNALFTLIPALLLGCTASDNGRSSAGPGGLPIAGAAGVASITGIAGGMGVAGASGIGG